MSVVDRLEGHIKFVERSNDVLAEECRKLHDIIREERTTNRLLLKRLGILEEIKMDVRSGDINPVGGITPLRTKIKEKELESRRKAERLAERLENAEQE